MKRLLILTAGLLALGISGLPVINPIAPPSLILMAQAAETEQSVTFDVPGMTCALCPVTVRKAMEGVEGVRQVEVDFEARTATVVFDPSAATIEAIAAASANAGYPAAVKG